MEEHLIKALPFLEKDVDTQNITLSLLQLLSYHNCISEAYQIQIKEDMDKLFLELAGQYTRRASSSLPVKVVEKIYESILFQADVYLNSFNNILEAAHILLSLPIKEIILNGQSLILQYYKEIHEIFKQVYKTRLSIPIQEYQYAINKAFDDFLKNYDARFSASDIVTSLDYPLLHGNWMPEKGILYIRAYYTALMLENKFCSFFKDGEIDWILKMYGQKYHCKYTELLFNISEVLLNNLLAGALLSKELFTIRLNENECTALQEKFINWSNGEIESAVLQAFEPYEIYIKDTQLTQYIQKYLPVFTLEFYTRVKNKNLKNYICFDT